MSCPGGLIDACTQAAGGVLTPSQAQAVLNQQLIYVMAILLIGGVASGLRAYLFNSAAERVMCRLRVQLFSKVRSWALDTQPQCVVCLRVLPCVMSQLHITLVL